MIKVRPIRSSICIGFMLFLSVATTAQTLTSDKLDYPPGNTATLTATGFQPGKQIRFQVVHADYQPGDPIGDDHEPWYETADLNGIVITSWHVCEDDCVGELLKATADGETSGWHAETTFTDAATSPAAQSLDYSQNFSSLPYSGVGSNVYPTGWQGWKLVSSGGSSSSFRTNDAAADESLIAAGAASTTTGGVYNYNGKIGFLATSSTDPSIVLAISTSLKSNIVVQFDVMTIRNPYDGSSNTRINQVDLQYRIGSSGSFTSASGLVNGIYQNNTTTQTGSGITTPQNSLFKSFTLPPVCNNQSLVQLRWVQRDFFGGGSRPGFAIDNISVVSCSDPTDTDGDGLCNSLDTDDDNDGIPDAIDGCPVGETGWISNASTDHDGDGCKDASEDTDDDNDGIVDAIDGCPVGETGWTSNPSTDHDGDGCKDATEDNDDDNDGIPDAIDGCAVGETGWISNASTDHDDDGCKDATEDTDDDNDGIPDVIDACPVGETGWISNASTDHDGDGCKDATEDTDDDNDGIADVIDGCPVGETGWISNASTDHDGDGCKDATEDTDDDNDGTPDAIDRCPVGETGWISNASTDHDGDGCKDATEDTDDDNDGIPDAIDGCPVGETGWISNASTDYDGDGCKDATEDADDDNDGVLDINDCQPLNPNVYPGAPEICGNGMDDNCDGIPDESITPTGATASANNFCANAGGILELNAIGGTAGTGALLKWYAGSCESGTMIGSGNPLTINKPTTTTTYFARFEGACNNTGCVSVTVNVLAGTVISDHLINSVSTKNTEVIYGCSMPVLRITAAGHGTLYYKWFKNTTNSNSGGTQVSSSSLSPSYTIPGAMPAGTYYYYAEATAACGSAKSDVFKIVIKPQEADAANDGSLYYTGVANAWTPTSTSNTATVMLSAFIKNKSSDNCGDIATAIITFETKNQSGIWTPIPSAQNLPVYYVDPNNPARGGTAAAIAQLNITNNSATQIFDLRVVVTGNYTANPACGMSQITVSKLVPGGSISGGVILCGNTSTGLLRPSNLAPSLLGFGVEYVVKQGKPQSPKGKVNLYVPSFYSLDGSSTFPHFNWYKITSNAIASLAITNPTATFTAKANVAKYNPVTGETTAVEGNCTMVLDVKDVSVTGYSNLQDLIGVTIYKNAGGVWYSNNWLTSKTVVRTICGGDLTVTGATSAGATYAVKSFGIEEQSADVHELNVRATPNPTKHSFTLSIQSNNFFDKVVIKVRDAVGRQVFIANGSSNTDYQFGDKLAPGVYIVEVTQRNRRIVIKVIKQ